MDVLDFAQDFIERCERAHHLSELTAAFSDTIARLGFRYFACGSHVDPLRPRHAVMLQTYPDAWVRTFSDSAWHEIDPVFLRANKACVAFEWDSPDFHKSLTTSQHKILAEAERYGIAHGFTVPLHSPRLRGMAHASCSVVPAPGQFDRRHCLIVAAIAGHLFDAALRIVDPNDPATSRRMLTPRQAQCLGLVADGKDDEMIAQLLRVEKSTAHNHIEHAKQRLGAASRPHAVAKALALREISYDYVPASLKKAPA